MTREQISRCIALRNEDRSYAEISEAIGISRNTIKSYFARHKDNSIGTGQMPDGECLHCGKLLFHTTGKKHRKFCCPKCRQEWWNTHQDMVCRKAVYTFTCLGCGKVFTAYGNAGRKYCSHPCYIRTRFGGNDE